MAKFPKREGFDAAVERFLTGVRAANAEYFKRFENLTPDEYRLDPLQRYLRITRTTIHERDGVKTDNQTMVFCFIEYTTGLVFKPEGWKKPAKHARGDIFSDQHGMEAVSRPQMCIRYL